MSSSGPSSLTSSGKPFGKMRLTLQMLISHVRVARKMGLGPESRINMLRNMLTGLVRHERIETTQGRADEVRFYAEKVRARRVELGSSS